MFSSSRKRGGADAFENDPSFMSKATVERVLLYSSGISNSAEGYCSCTLKKVRAVILTVTSQNYQGIPSELQYYYHAVQHVSQAPPGRAKCPADPHARRRPKRQAVKGAKRPGREQGRHRAWGSRGHFGGRCCLTAGATTDHSQMLGACGIQTDRSQHYV